MNASVPDSPINTAELRPSDCDPALLAAIVQSSDDAILSKTLEGVITSWNPGAQRLFGYTAEEAVGRSITMLIPPDRLHEEEHILDRLRRGMPIDQMETVRVTKDGRLLNIRLSISPIRDATGRVIGASKIARDITQEVRTAEALRRSEQRYRSLTRAACSIVWTTDAAGQVVEYMPDWEAYTGASWDEHRGSGWARSLHPDDRDRIQTIWADAVRRRAEYRVEGRVWHAATKCYRHFEGRGVPILDDDGNVAEWIGTYVDTHDRVIAEAALSESRRHFELLLELLPAGVVACDAHERVTYFNERAVEIWGVRPEHGQQVRQIASALRPTQDGASDPVQETPMQLAVRTGESFRNVEMKLHRQDGSVNWVLANTDPIRDEDGNVTGAICAFLDLTELLKAQSDLRSLNEHLEQRVAERTHQAEHRTRQLRALARELTLTEQQERQRIAALLHDDLVQLLAVSKIQLGLLSRRLAQSPQKAGESVVALEELIDESIKFTRTLMSDLTPPTLNRGNLGAAIRWVAEKLQKHQLNVDVHEAEPLEDLEEDVVVVVFQSVRELLFNVVKHAGVNRADVHLTRNNGHIEVVVADRGKGFETDKPIEPSSDGGFGLFHLRERLDMMGGGVAIESAHGRGTRVTLHVPCHDNSDASPTTINNASAVQRPPRKKLADSGKTIRVLLVDDHAMVREGLRHVMQQYHDIEVVGEADDGASAIDQAQRLSPDVVLMDVNLPRVNGIEATRRIRQELPQVHVIALSIHNDDEIISAMRDVGAAAYLTKAEASESLYATLRSLVLAEQTPA